jgi:NADH-quinone oxidoreductase subunit B
VGTGFFATSMDQAMGLARKNSLVALALRHQLLRHRVHERHELALRPQPLRHGALQFQPAPERPADGDGHHRQEDGPVLREVYMQMAEPKWVLSMGACASSGGIFDTYSVLQGIDRVIPVDVYIPGCPPTSRAVIDGILKIQELAKNESLRRRYSKEYEDLLAKYAID